MVLARINFTVTDFLKRFNRITRSMICDKAASME